MRLFIAIDLSRKVKKEIASSIKNLASQSPQVSWIKEDNFHLTLKFLGNINKKFKMQNAKLIITNKNSNKNSKIEKIKRGIEKSIEEIAPFELEFTKLGYFAREQLIVWLGIRENQQLSQLAGKITAEMAKLGFSKERRNFSPHITIGRGKRLSQVIRKKIIVRIKKGDFTTLKPFKVSELALMQSTLTPKGAIYTKIAKFSL